MNRRTDNDLRQSISVIERMLLTEPSAEMVTMRCLQQLINLLKASYGYVYECGDLDEDGHIPWDLIGTCEAKAGQLVQLANTSTSRYITVELQPKLSAGRCFGGEPNPTSLSSLPHAHPEIINYYCVPLVDAHRIYAVVYLCNAEDGFDQNTENRLRPFIAASSCLLRTANKVRDFQQTRQDSDHIAEHPELLLGVINGMFNGVVMVNANDDIVMCNRVASSMFCLPPKEIIGSPLTRFLPGGSVQLSFRKENSFFSAQSADGDDAVSRGVRAVKGNGKKMLVDLRAFEIQQGDQVLRGLVMDDISERIRSSSDYHETLQRFEVLTNLAPVGILQLDRNWCCTYTNDTWCEYCQVTPDEAMGTGWLKGLHSLDAESTLSKLRHDTGLTGRFEGELRLQSPLGRITWVKANACSLYAESGETTGLIIIFNDITERLSNERRLQDIAEKDQLTGLVNRAFFNDRVETALQGIDRFGSVALMFIDLDEFKPINDTFGHQVGDQLLCEVAIRMKETLRQADTIARIGGDEFTVLLTNVVNTRAITVIADKLLAALADPFLLNTRPIYISLSIGIAVANTSDGDAKKLFKQADAALYKAKTAGRNQYKFYTDALDKDANLHIHLRQSLKEPGRSDFRIVYQPQVDARSGVIKGLELLTRWQHSDAESTGPDVFIKMIEESGLINEFSEWLLEEVFSTICCWEAMPGSLGDLTISINLSAKQFRNKDLALHIFKKCQLYRINPRRIVFEITETALIDDPKIASGTLQKLRDMGFGVSLDDFGTGYSSLVYLRKMPLQSIKIDRSFIKDITQSEGDARIVSAILVLASTLELDVIAEGVDNNETKEWLLQHGCPIQQGFYFHKPLEKEAVEKLLKLEAKPNNKPNNIVPITININ